MEIFRPTVVLILLILCVMGFGASAHCARTTLPIPHADTVAQFQQNPYVYLYGEIISGEVMHMEHETFTSISFQPGFTLLNEKVLFCGNQAKAFNGKMGPIVVTYSRKAPFMSRGVGCHELESVDEVPPAKEQ